jgi:predicted transcriptional regulator
VGREKPLELAQVIELLDCEVLAGAKNLKISFDTVFAADLMSDVLAFTAPGSLLLTGLTNVQSVITGHVAEVKAIVYVRGKKPDADAVRLAEQKGLPLLATQLSMFTACGRLFAGGLRPNGDEDRK